MGHKFTKNIKLKNYTEAAIIEELERHLKQTDFCKCRKCRADMLTYCLNRLPARYARTDLGNAYTKINQQGPQTRVDITVLILEAARVVKRRPRH